MNSFEYLEPHTLKEAVSLLVKHGPRAKILAGGTDLLLRMQQGAANPGCIINIRSIPDLNYIQCEKEIRIGATTVLSDIANSSQLLQKCPMMVDVTRQFAALPIANMATIGGNLCNACPACDTGPPLIALSAKARLVGPESNRIVPVEQLFRGPGSTVLKGDEILAEVQIPLPPPDSRWSYIKHVLRGGSDLAMVAVAVVVGIESGYFTHANIALGAVSPTPTRAKQAREALEDAPVSAQIIDQAASLASRHCRPISDVRASAEYRRNMVYVLTRRALRSCSDPIIEGCSP